MEKLEERPGGQGRSALVTQADPMGAPEPERPSVLQGHVGSSLSNQALDTSCDPRLAGPSLKGSPRRPSAAGTPGSRSQPSQTDIWGSCKPSKAFKPLPSCS